ncbi:MAG: DUF302 domain-containing protein [Gordonia sp. (in: high G+C Gram-positive bacteria)]
MQIALATAVDGGVPENVDRVKQALAAQGFGVLTEIDMAATLKAKIGASMEDYLILGACNPPAAHRAVNAERQIGLLLPCNVVLRDDVEHPGRTLVEAMNPELMVSVAGDDPELRTVADEVTVKLQAALDSL